MTDEKAETSSEELSIDALVEQLTKERDEFKDIALRVQAEFENYRKRSATQLFDECINAQLFSRSLRFLVSHS